LTSPRDASKVTFVTIGTTRGPADEAGVDSAAARPRRPLLGRLGVGAKLMLLVLLPVGVLLGFTIAEAASNWRTALSLRDFQNATEQSFAATDVAAALAEERMAAALTVLRPGDAGIQRLHAAQAGVDAALKVGTGRAGAWVGTVDLGGRLDAALRQLNAVRVELVSNSLTVPESADAYGSIMRDLLRTVGQLDAAAPTRPSARASQAYVAIVEAIEAAAREQVDVAALFASEPADALAASSATRWSGLEAAQLDVFRDNATGPVAADLEAVQFSPSGITVTAVRDALANPAPGAPREPSLTGWLDASGTRIASLRDLQGVARKNLAATASNDLAAARTGSLRDVSVSLAVLLIVTGLALALRRSITSPLREVSEAAQHLSSGDLTVHVDYRGRDEIGDVATAFRNLHVTVERLAKEIREMTAAVRHNQLGHRADIAALEGTWSQLLAGLNDTMAAFAEVEGRRERAERELSDFFQLSLDLLCIGNFDGYFTRVNPAFEQTLGYTSAELTSRPFVEFAHPDDRELTAEAFSSQKRGNELIGLENRYICSDGSVRWLQWTARALPDEGFACAVARDITERRRNEEEQSALRRVATAVAQGASPAETFAAVAAEVGQLFGGDLAAVFRYSPEREATLVGGWSVPGIAIPISSHFQVMGTGVGVRVFDTQRPARTERFEGPPGSMAAFFASCGARRGVGAPITVEGRLWGVLVIVSIDPDRLPAGSERRTAQFTDLLATAVANAEAREALRRVADEQAALRRVATQVAAAAPPNAVFAGVAEEVGRLLSVDRAYVARYDADSAVTVVAAWSATGETLPIGPIGRTQEGSVSALVRETRRPARVDRDETDAASAALELGVHTAVGAPITVKSRPWGLIVVASTAEEPPPRETEARLGDFTELVAIAIANADAQAELTASRARIVAAGDQARQRFERDLHDGTQQRLVSLALELRTVLAAVPPELTELSAQLDRAVTSATDLLDELREITRGIHPAILTKGGLAEALRALARRSPIPVRLDLRVPGPLPQHLEASAYYVVAEAQTNAAKHSRASLVSVTVVTDTASGVLHVAVSDDGVGGAHFDRGTGLVGLKDRAEAMGGGMFLDSRVGAGTTLRIELPLSATPVAREIRGEQDAR
jgi:PAS domain S-box-containing protein